MASIALAAAVAGCATPAPAASDGAGRAAAAKAQPPPELLEFQDLLIPPGSCRAPAPERISAAEALADLAVVERVVHKGYAGYEILAREGLDWSRVFADLRARLSAASYPMEVEAIRTLLLSGLSPARDRHLALWSVDAAGTWRWGAAGALFAAYASDVLLTLRPSTAAAALRAASSAPGERSRAGGATGGAGASDWVVARAPRDGPPEGARLIDCEDFPRGAPVEPTLILDPHPAVAGLLVVRSAAGDVPASLRCRFAAPAHAGAALPAPQAFALALHRMRSGAAAGDATAPVFEQRRDPASAAVALVRLRSLATAHASALAEFASSAHALREAPAIVLDVRGNPGGTDAPLTDWFRELTAGELRQPVIEQLITEVTLQGRVNDFTFALERQGGLDDAVRSRYESERAQARRELIHVRELVGRPFREWRIRTPTETGLAPELYRGRLVVLVDDRCASACETAVFYARQLPGTLVVGTNTAGMGRFGDARPFRLPNSRLWLQAGSKWFHEPTAGAAAAGRIAAEGEGYAPDLWVDSDDAGALAAALARCTLSAPCRSRLDEGFARAKAALGETAAATPHAP